MIKKNIFKIISAALIPVALFAGVPLTASAQTVSNEAGTATEWIESKPIEQPEGAATNSGAVLDESVEKDIAKEYEQSFEVSGPIDAQPGEYSDSSEELFNFDEKVHRLKENLMDLGYMQRDIITDVYDPYTQLGVMFFQRANNLPVTGIADEQTLNAANSEDAIPYKLTPGTQGEDVRRLQNALQSLGYTLSSTGTYDNSTQTSIAQYASAHDISADSGADGELIKIICDDAALHGDFTAIKDYAANPAADSRIEALIAVAEQQLGKPYVLGGKGPDVFDCSGLVYYCLNQSGYEIGYMTSGGWAASSFETIEGMDNLRRGDIVCFTGHVGIYLGDGLMLDASSSEGKIRITNDIRKTAYWQNTFLYGKRVF